MLIVGRRFGGLGICYVFILWLRRGIFWLGFRMGSCLSGASVDVFIWYVYVCIYFSTNDRSLSWTRSLAVLYPATHTSLIPASSAFQLTIYRVSLLYHNFTLSPVRPANLLRVLVPIAFCQIKVAGNREYICIWDLWNLNLNHWTIRSYLSWYSRTRNYDYENSLRSSWRPALSDP